MNNIDRRINYILMLDTETCNTIENNGRLNMSNVLVYDIGFQVIDKKGRVYEKGSFCIYDIFVEQKKLMKSAYYADKIPAYWEDIKSGKRELKTWFSVRKIILNIIEKYNIHIVSAHNARFDYNALNITMRYITKSSMRYYFPKDLNIVWWDTLKMARDTIGKQKTYIQFCFDNGFVTKHKTPQVRLTAETLYRYMTNNPQFEESHTGFEDVTIETKILAKCFAQHKKMRKLLWEN